jgi:AraC-like DNA-binding protein
LAELVYLSSSRLSHLFKEETGLSVRQFVLHRKLVKSLQAMYEQHNFTESSFMGGFSDQLILPKLLKMPLLSNPLPVENCQFIQVFY